MPCNHLPAERSLDGLDPDFRERVSLLLFLCPQIFVTESTRSKERQECLISVGASKIAQSLHQKGLAIDIAFLGDELYPSNMAKWEKVASIAKELGIDWGFALWQWDKAHFQTNFKDKERKYDTLHDYLKIAAKEIPPVKRVFSEYSGDNYIKEKDVKLLIEIAISRALLNEKH